MTEEANRNAETNLAHNGWPPEKWFLHHACGPCWVSQTVCSFRVWAPHGEKVSIEFEGGKRMTLLQRDGDFWHGEAEAAPGDRYRLAMESSWNDCFDQEGAVLLRRDPCARECDFNSSWCVLLPVWDHPLPCAVPKFNEMVMYELHLGSWVPSADEHCAFLAAAERLDYISKLGFNCVQLMPTTEFGGIWGYNSRQLLASHGPWGHAEDLRFLVEKAHSLGLAVIFDIVLNHGASKRNVLWNWDGFGANNSGGIYFEGETDTPWGRRFAFHKAEVKDYLKQSARTWIEEYGVDGLRFDSVHNMPWALLQEMTSEIKQHYPDKILIAEITPEDPKVVTDAGFHSCWLHATHFDSLKILKQFDGGETPQKRMGMLKNMACLHRAFPSIGGVHSILGSHDQCGDRHEGNQDGRGTHRYYIHRLGGRGNWHARAQCRALFAFQNCCRGLPMTFMGSETLQEQWWHVDEHHRFNWELAQGDDIHKCQMHALVSESNRLRTSNHAFVSDNIRVVHEDAQNIILGFVRWEGDDAFFCVLHLGEVQWENREYGVSTCWGVGRRWLLVLSSQAGDFGGWDGSSTHEAVANEESRIFINIPKWSLLVYKAQ